MRLLDLRDCSTGRERGLRHGQTFAGEIRSLCDIRIYLACKISGFEREGLLAAADEHLPVLEQFDNELYDELVGIAEGAGVPASYLVVLNHYTDLRDLTPPSASEGEADFDGGCTMLWSRGDKGAVFAQTWDMHASATPYVMMLRVSDADGGDAWILSLTGCLGMAGLNATGMAIGINNLTSTDAKVGVVWSALIRQALRQTSVAVARDVILGAPLGSGHHYLVCDASEVYSIETSGTHRKVIFDGGKDSFVHSNHCLDGEVGACSRVPPKSTSYDRHEAMLALMAKAPVRSAEDAWEYLGSHEGYPRSICTNMATPELPHAAATCAGIAIELAERKVLAVGGFTHAVAPGLYTFDE